MGLAPALGGLVEVGGVELEVVFLEIGVAEVALRLSANVMRSLSEAVCFRAYLIVNVDDGVVA